MKKNYRNFLAIIISLSFGLINAQTEIATEVIILNGESFGGGQSNIASYNLVSKTYEVFDTMGTNSIQDLLIEDNIAFVAAQSKVFSYDLDTKTKIAEVDFPGASTNKGAIFTDDNYVFVGNWYGQADSNLYAFNKTTLAYEFAVNEAVNECTGGLSLNDTLYISQVIKGTIDACPPYGCFADTMGAIVIANANTGTYYRTINLGVSGAGISKIYTEGNYIFAVCAATNKILKIEIGTDIITEISLAPFSKSFMKQGSKVYMDLNGKAGYLDLTDESMALSATVLSGVAIGFDPSNETAFFTATDYFSYGSLIVSNNMIQDTVAVGISPEVFGLVFTTNNAPVTMDDNYEFLYEDTVSEYQLSVLDNDTDADMETLTITNVTSPNIAGAMAVIDGQEIKYTRAAGIATTDYFTYTACDAAGACSTSIVHVVLNSVLSVNNIAIENMISIYPNPAKDVLKINTSSLTFIKATIINSVGKTVKNSKESEINLENIPSGLYFTKVYTNEGFVIAKLIIQ